MRKKRCGVCEQTKNESEFYLRSDNGKPRGTCKPCLYAQDRAAYRLRAVSKPKGRRGRHPLFPADHPFSALSRTTRQNLVARIGRRDFDEREIAIVMAARDPTSRCTICGGLPNGAGNVFHVDHDKETGKIRGHLCGNCNQALGKFQHNTDILARAIEYLTKSAQI